MSPLTVRNRLCNLKVGDPDQSRTRPDLRSEEWFSQTIGCIISQEKGKHLTSNICSKSLFLNPPKSSSFLVLIKDENMKQNNTTVT